MDLTNTDIIFTGYSRDFTKIPFFNPTSKRRKKYYPTDNNAPQMITISETSQRTGISEHRIRLLCKSKEIQFIKAGTKYLINYDRFIDYLNGKSNT